MTRKPQVQIALDPEQPKYGDELRVTVTGGNLAVFEVRCTQDGQVVYGAGGNANDPTVTLSSLSWTGGPAECVVEAKGQRHNGDPYTVASKTFSVEE